MPTRDDETNDTGLTPEASDNLLTTDAAGASNATSGMQTVDASPDPEAPRRALERVMPMALAIADKQLLPIRLDPPTIAMFLLNRLRAIEPYREAISELSRVNHEWLSNLESIALALIQVDSLSRITVKQLPAVKAAFKEACRLRSRLAESARILHKEGVLPRGSLANLKVTGGYKHTAQDLMALGSVLRDNWGVIGGRTTITMDDVDRSSVLAQILYRTAESRTKRAAVPAELALLKRQVYTLFLLAYDELQRCLDFIERGAAKRLAPTLYQGRGRKPAAAKLSGAGREDVLHAGEGMSPLGGADLSMGGARPSPNETSVGVGAESDAVDEAK